MSKLLSVLFSLRLIPHICVFYTSAHKDLLIYERDRWLQSHGLTKRGCRGLLLLLNSYREYRSLFYFRTKATWLSFFAKPQNNLEFYSESNQIGRGLIIWHGFSTVINVESMGEDCEIWQNVTIGKSSTDNLPNRPHIGNRVKVTANSVVIGNIVIADDVTIAAGAVAVKNIPDEGAIIVSQPSRIIAR